MKLIIGLGNPGSQYELTRHNIGFIAVDLFAQHFKIIFKEGKGDWLEGKGSVGDEEVYLFKPTTYMNNSGVAVREMVDRYSADTKDILIVVDDFQIPLGTISVRRDGSDGGHNGLENIIYHLNSDRFPRMRIGIGKDTALKKDDFIDFVLSNFTKEEIEIIKKLIPHYNDCIESFIVNGITKTMNEFNRSFI